MKCLILRSSTSPIPIETSPVWPFLFDDPIPIFAVNEATELVAHLPASAHGHLVELLQDDKVQHTIHVMEPAEREEKVIISSEGG